MLKEVKKNMLDKRCCINWFNFFVGDMFYTDNGNYRVNIADHENRTIQFINKRR